MIRKNLTKKLKEDFDFNKVKKHDIQDEYEFSSSVIRTQINYKCDLNDILNKQYSFNIKNASEKGYYDIIGQCYYNKTKSLESQSIIVPEEFRTQIKNIIKILNNLDDDFNVLLASIICWWLNMESIDDLKDIMLSDEKTYQTDYIEYWVSEDNGIIIVTDVESLCKFGYYVNKRFIDNYANKRFIACYTGKVDYSKEYKLNEDFDFGKVKSKRIEDDYTITKDVIRKANNKSINNINDVCVSLWNYSIRPQLRSEHVHLAGGEELWCPNRNYQSLPNMLSRKKHLTWDDTKVLLSSGFTKYKFYPITGNYVSNIKDTPDYIQELIYIILRVPFDDIWSTEYFLSPDKGIVIFCNIQYNTNNKFRVITTSIIMYTGLVLYSMVSDINSDKVNDTNIKENLAIVGEKFINRLFKYITNQINYYLTYNIFEHNNHLIMSFNKKLSWSGVRVHKNLETLFFDYTENKHGTKVLNSISPFFVYNQVIDPMDIIIKKYDKSTNNIIAGYMSSDKNICLYYVSDYNTVVKLVGAENAKLINKVLFNVKGFDKKEYWVYAFWYVTDKGMELFRQYQNGKISLRNI